MKQILSHDGTPIAFDQLGEGPPIILVGGGPTDRSADAPLAELLAPRFAVINDDRRGRGDSGDPAPYAIEREVEDLEALVTDAGGSAFVYGTSSGAVVALRAAACGLPITKLALWEPPFIVDDSRPPVPQDYKARRGELISSGHRGDAIASLMTTSVGLPAEAVAPMRQAPCWSAMAKVAHTIVDEADVMGDYSLPTERVASVTVPTLVIDGGEPPWISRAAQAVAGTLPNAQRRTLQGQPHNVAPEAIAPALAECFAG